MKVKQNLCFMTKTIFVAVKVTAKPICKKKYTNTNSITFIF